MSYIIQWSSQINGDTGTYAPSNIGKSTINLADATTDSTSTSLTLTGRGYAGYGAIQQENFIQLLENFASETAPANPTVGQLWFNTSNESLQVYQVQATGTPATLGWSQIYPLTSTQISDSLGYTPVDSSSIFGTANEVIVTVASGNVTFSTPQPIATTSSPTFQALTLSNAGGAASSAAIQAFGAVNGYAGLFYNQTSTANESFGVQIQAGTSATDWALRIYEYSATHILQEIFGDGSFTLGYNGAGSTISANAIGNVTLNAPNSGTTLTVANSVTGAATTAQIKSTYSSVAASPLLSLLSTASTGSATLSLCGNNGTIGTNDFSIYQSGSDLSGNILVHGSGVLNLGAGGHSAQWSISANGNLTNIVPVSGVAATISGKAATTTLTVASGRTATDAGSDIYVTRAGSTLNSVGEGPNIQFTDTASTKGSIIQHSAGQTEFWQSQNGTTWAQALVLDSSATPNVWVRNSLNIASVTTFGNYVIFANNVWNNSADGKNRLYFGTNADSYYEAAAGYHHFRNGSSSDVVTIDMSGNIVANGNVTGASDRALKTEIETISNALEKVKQLNGVTFKRVDLDGQRQTGLIAQDVERVLPEAVTQSSNGLKALAYGNLAGILVEAIKELSAQIEAIKEKLWSNK